MYNIFKVNGKVSLVHLFIFIILPVVIEAFILKLNSNALLVYNLLEKPFFAVPPLIFVIVWSIFDLLMGIAAYRIYMIRELGQDVGNALFYFIIQILFKILWIFIFFSFRLYGIAFFEAKVVLVFWLLTLTRFIKLDKIAAILFGIQIFILTYLSIFNFFIWVNNEM